VPDGAPHAALPFQATGKPGAAHSIDQTLPVPSTVVRDKSPLLPFVEPAPGVVPAIARAERRQRPAPRGNAEATLPIDEGARKPALPFQEAPGPEVAEVGPEPAAAEAPIMEALPQVEAPAMEAPKAAEKPKASPWAPAAPALPAPPPEKKLPPKVNVKSKLYGSDKKR
jgi:hypothetical protein